MSDDSKFTQPGDASQPVPPQPADAGAGTPMTPPAADAPASSHDAPSAPSYDASPAPSYDASPAPSYDAPSASSLDAPPAPTYGGAPQYDAAPGYGAAPQSNPGQTLGIVAIVVCFFIAPLGAILGFVAANQSKKVGMKNTPAKVAIILGIVFTVIWIIVIIMMIIGFANLAALCGDLGPGVHTSGGVTITCG